MTIWFDVDDLIQYFGYAHRPTGIQRVSIALYRELHKNHGPKIRFCRRCPGEPSFRTVDFPALEAALLAIIAGAEPAATEPEAATPQISPLRATFRRLPPKFRRPLGRLAGATLQILAALRDLVRASAPQRLQPLAPPPLIAESQFDLSPAIFHPGDWLLNLGNSWNKPYAAASLTRLRTQGVKFALLIHDLIPELFPEWSAPETMREFRAWLRHTIPKADLILAVSKNSAADIARFLQASHLPLPPIQVLPIGAAALAQSPFAPAPAQKPFILMVGTIEVRKNHILMFRVWQKLLQSMPKSQVPDLVFAGKIGWLTADFLQQMANTNWLGGKIRFLNAPTDAQLAALYQTCLFTVFPSLYEGWGLPVTESLTFGKTAAASNRAAIPEAGGNFCTYFDPENPAEASAVIHHLIEHPERVAELESRIAKSFRPPSWADSATALLAALTPEPALMEEAA